MLYRKFGKCGNEISILGFGAMRLPILDGDESKIDEKSAASMLSYAIEHGVNYIDTAWPYHQGNSELFLGKALQAANYRDKIYLATKMPAYLIQSPKDMDYYLNEQLQRLKTDHIDYYLLHALNKTYWQNLMNNNVLSFLDKALADGRIRYAGFSYHEEPAYFKTIVDAYPWEFCQIQYNYLDTHFQAGEKGLEYAAQQGLGLIIMEPLKGGKLAEPVPKDVQAIWDKADTKRSAVEWALRFLWDDKRIGIVLSGMSNLKHVKDNIAIAESSQASLTSLEKALYDEARLAYEKRTKVACTGCRYCANCPANIHIADVFKYYNRAFMFEDSQSVRQMRSGFGKDCIHCGKCEVICPQHIPIQAKLEEAALYLANSKIN